MTQIKLILAYEGTHYLGWQKTKEGLSIEGELEKVLTRLLQHPITLQAASRTDRGVHALYQVVGFHTPTSPNLFRLKRALHGLLPKDIALTAIEIVPDTFHPTLDATYKEYHYHLSFEEVLLPHERNFLWHYPYPLDLQKMEKSFCHFIGEKDFTSLTNDKVINPIRKVREIEIVILRPRRVFFKITGNSFLYKMVRNIVGTLVYIGLGKIDGEKIPAILQSKDRRRMGMTAPAQGLFLAKVEYPTLH